MEDIIRNCIYFKKSKKKYSFSDNSFQLNNDPLNDEGLKLMIEKIYKKNEISKSNFDMTKENFKKLKNLSKYFLKLILTYQQKIELKKHKTN
jgi:hypothetical protein